MVSERSTYILNAVVLCILIDLLLMGGFVGFFFNPALPPIYRLIQYECSFAVKKKKQQFFEQAYFHSELSLCACV